MHVHTRTFAYCTSTPRLLQLYVYSVLRCFKTSLNASGWRYVPRTLTRFGLCKGVPFQANWLYSLFPGRESYNYTAEAIRDTPTPNGRNLQVLMIIMNSIYGDCTNTDTHTHTLKERIKEIYNEYMFVRVCISAFGCLHLCQNWCKHPYTHACTGASGDIYVPRQHFSPSISKPISLATSKGYPAEVAWSSDSQV